jgi:CubicO group peptidase (beta-lactamase class C family)
MIETIELARRTIASAIDSRVFPAATLEVGRSAAPIWQDALGTAGFDDPTPVSLETPFDLASLTKPIATTTVVMQGVFDRRLRLDDRVSAYIPEWRGPDRAEATLRDLLEHASGLPARLIDALPSSRREFEHDISTMPLEYAPRSRSVYSDLGFILLGFIAADRAARPLDEQFDAVRIGLTGGVSRDVLRFALDPGQRRRAAPTWPMAEDVRRGRRLVGEVHDDYAWALGGVAGHAGLFGTASAVGAFARAVLRAARGEESVEGPLPPQLVREFVTRSSVPESSRALGWDTMLPTSSCGTRMSSSAFGHLGFTGTSLWIDPGRDRYFVLLTNRANQGGTLIQMREVRRAFHDAVAEI